MNKKEICNNTPVLAYYSGLGGLEIHDILYGINNYIICVSGAWCGSKKYHKLKIYYDNTNAYIKLNGYKIPLNECIRMGI